MVFFLYMIWLYDLWACLAGVDVPLVVVITSVDLLRLLWCQKLDFRSFSLQHAHTHIHTYPIQVSPLSCDLRRHSYPIPQQHGHTIRSTCSIRRSDIDRGKNTRKEQREGERERVRVRERRCWSKCQHTQEHTIHFLPHGYSGLCTDCPKPKSRITKAAWNASRLFQRYAIAIGTAVVSGVSDMAFLYPGWRILGSIQSSTSTKRFAYYQRLSFV